MLGMWESTHGISGWQLSTEPGAPLRFGCASSTYALAQTCQNSAPRSTPPLLKEAFTALYTKLNQGSLQQDNKVVRAVAHILICLPGINCRLTS